MDQFSFRGHVYEELRLSHQKFETLMSEEGQPSQWWGYFIRERKALDLLFLRNESIPGNP